MLDKEREALNEARARRSTLSRRSTKILVVAAVILVIVLSYLSAVILIEGARNPDEIPQPQQEMVPAQ